VVRYRCFRKDGHDFGIDVPLLPMCFVQISTFSSRQVGMLPPAPAPPAAKFAYEVMWAARLISVAHAHACRSDVRGTHVSNRTSFDGPVPSAYLFRHAWDQLLRACTVLVLGSSSPRTSHVASTADVHAENSLAEVSTLPQDAGSSSILSRVLPTCSCPAYRCSVTRAHAILHVHVTLAIQGCDVLLM
jgi:hypothetical protein